MAETVTLARPYAKAAFMSALEDKNLAAWSKALALLAELESTDPVLALIDSPSLTAAQKSAELVKVCGDALSEKQSNLVAVLAENDRLALSSEISSLFEIYRAAHEQTVDVDIETAFELSDAQIASLKTSLKDTLSREVSVTSSVDKSLIGGVFIRAGDVVIDASLRGRLDKLAAAISA